MIYTWSTDVPKVWEIYKITVSYGGMALQNRCKSLAASQNSCPNFPHPWYSMAKFANLNGWMVLRLSAVLHIFPHEAVRQHGAKLLPATMELERRALMGYPDFQLAAKEAPTSLRRSKSRVEQWRTCRRDPGCMASPKRPWHKAETHTVARTGEI